MARYSIADVVYTSEILIELFNFLTDNDRTNVSASLIDHKSNRFLRGCAISDNSAVL